MLLVGDTGHGIPPEVMEKMFDPFFTTKEPGKGTGLGLSIVLGIIKSHGGFVRVNSRVDEGSEFKVYLPALPSPEPQSSTIAESAPSLPNHGELILVVDDEQAVREMTRRVLAANGYRVVTACDGAEALFKFSRSRKPIHAVLTDSIMPVMDGVSLIRALRRLSTTAMILMMSGLDDQEPSAMEAGLTAGGFLRKPFSAEQLLLALARLKTRAPAVPPQFVNRS
jgi:CheY-like chemotaxis protein